MTVSMAVGGTTTTNVTANITGQGATTIGSITIDPNVAAGGETRIEATFTLPPAFAYLDEWYDFRWVNILTGNTVDGQPVDADGDGNPDHPLVGELPAVDPAPSAAGGDDDEPFYWTDDEFANEHVEGASSSWSDDRNSAQGENVVLSFTTYLVAQSVTDTSIGSSTLCVLASFSWTSTTGTGAAESTEEVTGTNADCGDADAQTINTALGNALGGGFPGGWSADADCALSECPFVIDCIYTTVPGTVFGASTWTNDGVVIGTTFPRGKTPEVGVPQYDTTYLPKDANDWHWNVTIPCEGTTTTVSVWVENFKPGTTIEVTIVCSSLFLEDPQMLMVDLGNNSYTLFAGDVPLHAGDWSAYPSDLPPELGFQLTGASRANHVACDPDTPCSADFDDDGFVDAADLAVLLGGWSTIGGTDLDCDGITDATDLAILLGQWGACNCGPLALTQSSSFAIEPLAGVLCWDDATEFSLANQWARSFDLGADPLTAGQAFAVSCVDVAIQGNTGSNLVGTVRLYLDTDGGSPLGPGLDLVELAADAVLIPEASGARFLQARWDPPIQIPPDSFLVVVLDCPPHYDGFVVNGANNDGQSGPTYLRAPGCEVNEFAPLESLGFPNSHWVVLLHGDVSPVPQGADNRGVASIQFTPAGPPGLYTIQAQWVAESVSPGFVDLTTEVTFLVNGAPLGVTTQFATTSGASGPCIGQSPPCDGSACGTWDFGFVTLNGYCGESIASVIGINFCTCACAVLTVAPGPVPLTPGDIVTVELSPAPGSQPETIIGDEVLTVVFTGPPGCPGIGPCMLPHPEPGCEDPVCCSLVCTQLPECCEISWDVQCAQLATFLCN